MHVSARCFPLPPQLRDELAKRELDTKGVKDELIARLAAAMEQEEAEQGAQAAAAEAPAEPAQPSQDDANAAGVDEVQAADRTPLFPLGAKL